MTDYGRSAAETTATIEAQVQASVEKAHKAYAFREELDTLRGQARVGSTRVIVDATGLMLAIEFDDSMSELSPQQLQSEVMAATRAAQQDIAGLVSARTREVWGDGDPISRQMEKELDNRYAPKEPGPFDGEERR